MIKLNPGPPHNNQLQPQSEWNVFSSKGIHFIHLNVNSLLPEIDELRNIAKCSNAAVIGISESKLVMMLNIFFRMKLKMFSSKYCYQTQKQ